MIHYKLVKVMINVPDLANMIINVIIHYHKVLESIFTNQGLLFKSKFWSSLYYFIEIKRKLFTAFHLQTDGQTKRKNSMMEVYLRAFVNEKLDDWVKLLLMA